MSDLYQKLYEMATSHSPDARYGKVDPPIFNEALRVLKTRLPKQRKDFTPVTFVTICMELNEKLKTQIVEAVATGYMQDVAEWSPAAYGAAGAILLSKIEKDFPGLVDTGPLHELFGDIGIQSSPERRQAILEVFWQLCSEV